MNLLDQTKKKYLKLLSFSKEGCFQVHSRDKPTVAVFYSMSRKKSAQNNTNQCQGFHCPWGGHEGAQVGALAGAVGLTESVVVNATVPQIIAVVVVPEEVSGILMQV